MTRQTATLTRQQTPTTSPLSSGILQRKCACGQRTIAGGECEECQKKKSLLQRRAANQTETSEVPPIVHEVLKSPGQPLDTNTRAFMESSFGHDFSQVRVHTDAKAAKSARAVNALAYTVGQDVFFGAGQFSPGTANGQKLLAHELTHTVQQTSESTRLHRRLTVNSPGDAYELEAKHDQVPIIEKLRLSSQVATTQLQSASDIHETMNLGEEASLPEGAPGSSVPTPAGTRRCAQPNSVRLVSSHALSFPGYLTGGGICAVMEALPRRNLCSTGVVEQVTLASGATCPGTLLRPTLCSGSSVFTPGRNQVQTCRSLSMPTTGFVDRHSVQLRSTSVLHDSTRNPRNLDSCTFTCNQRYFIRTGRREGTVGRFQIRYDLAKGRQDGRNITTVRAAKTQRR
jgi:hypothetical protein